MSWQWRPKTFEETEEFKRLQARLPETEALSDEWRALRKRCVELCPHRVYQERRIELETMLRVNQRLLRGPSPDEATLNSELVAIQNDLEHLYAVMCDVEFATADNA